MRVLCIFAHPDDESAGIGGTIARLTQSGHTVHIISATNGSGGEVMGKAQEQFEKHNRDLGSLRCDELSAACKTLNATCEVLDFKDGHITNEHVWGELRQRFIEIIDRDKPDMVITFDHTGWYYHLDHVGVSIATTLAVQQSQHQDFAFVLAYVHMDQGRWKYIYPDVLPTTHSVSVASVATKKIAAIDAHASQNLESHREELLHPAHCAELFQLVWCKNPEARQFIDGNTIFQSMG